MNVAPPITRNMNVTPEQKIKWAILIGIAKYQKGLIPEVITAENVDDVFEDPAIEDYIQDEKNNVRQGKVETGIECDWSRHYESQSVAAKMPDGSWVGWTYWYGGGKHGEPEAIDWMNHAYDLDCQEEEKMVIVRTFTKV